MNILFSDFKKGVVKIKITDLDDLWHLSQIIEPGDFLTGKTTRKVKIGGEENAAISRRTITLTVEAETIDFAASGNALRVNGKIKQGPEDIPRGSYHAISIEEGGEYTLEKQHWLAYQKQKLQEAAERRYNYLLCVFDREEAIIALTKQSRYEILIRLQGEVPKKGKKVEIKKEFFEEIIGLLVMYNERFAPENVILASPAFYKEDLLKKITSPELKKKVVLAVCSDVSAAALDEVVKRPELSAILKNSRVREEQMLIDQLLVEISKNNLAVYGWKEVQRAAVAGAVRELLVTLDFLHQQKLEGNYKELDFLMKQVDKLEGKIHLLSPDFESGKKLKGLGGIAALLRYKLEW